LHIDTQIGINFYLLIELHKTTITKNACVDSIEVKAYKRDCGNFIYWTIEPVTRSSSEISAFRELAYFARKNFAGRISGNDDKNIFIGTQDVFDDQ